MSKIRKPIPKHRKAGKPMHMSGAHAAKKVMSKEARAAARKALRLKMQKQAEHQKEEEAALKVENEKRKVDWLLANDSFADFISRNVGKKAINIIKLLNEPQTDEKLATDLSVKINEVRRILNVLDTYGVARYDTNKDNKGWLTFKWYLDTEKLGELSQTIENSRLENGYKLQDGCNDFFFCSRCYKEQKVIMPFDAAFETQFKCDCGKQLKQLNKEEARAMLQGTETTPEGTTAG